MNSSGISRRSGLWPSAISDYMHGKYLAKQDKVDMLAKALNVSPVWLMGFDDPDIYAIENILPIKTKLFPLLGNIACGAPTEAQEKVATYVETRQHYPC